MLRCITTAYAKEAQMIKRAAVMALIGLPALEKDTINRMLQKPEVMSASQRKCWALAGRLSTGV